MSRFLNQKKIVAFVEAVEKHKKFIPDPNLVFRHMISEMGELDAAMHVLDTLIREEMKSARFQLNLQGAKIAARSRIATELLDLVFLACYMASIHKINLDELVSIRMASIAVRYGLEWPPQKRKTRNASKKV